MDWQALMGLPPLEKAKGFAWCAAFSASLLVYSWGWGWTDQIPVGKVPVFRCEAVVLDPPRFESKSKRFLRIRVGIVAPRKVCQKAVPHEKKQRSIRLPPAFFKDPRLVKGAPVVLVIARAGGAQLPVMGLISTEEKVIAGPHAMHKAIELANNENLYQAWVLLLVTLVPGLASLWNFWKARREAAVLSDPES